MNYYFEKGKFTEAELESAIIELFKQQNYTYIDGDTMHRQYTDVLLTDELTAFLAKRYKSDGITAIEIERAISKLENIPSTPLYSGNKQAHAFVTSGFDLIRDDPTQIALHISFIDFDDTANNCFKVINQYSVEDKRLRRPDMLLFINGIPVAIFEFKTAIEEDKTIFDAWKQITVRYTRDIPSLMKYCFMSVISDGANTKLGTIFTDYAYYYAWNKANDDEKVSNGIAALYTMIKGAFAHERVLSILRDFILYPDAQKGKDDSGVIICRYPQFFAAHKMYENIKKHMKPDGDGKGGTYFGATGCGKTFIMVFLSRLIAMRDSSAFHNPTILIITDREDLDSQAAKRFVTSKTFLNEEDVRSIESRQDLQKTLRDKPSGGIYITTIQKFCEDIGLLSDRSNIICISDEAHRTQTNTAPKLKKTDKGVFTTYGFAKYLRESFPNATYCGFTGTPIDETISVFGEVVDSYTMKESTDDGITVRISYQPRLARVIVSNEKAKEINRYYEKCAEEGSNPEQIEASKKAMAHMNKVLGDPDRLAKLAKDIVEHYEALCEEKPDVVQKAMIVCNEREIGYNLMQAILAVRPEWGEPHKSDKESELPNENLDKLIALPKINLVATQGDDDSKELYEACGNKKHREMLDEQFKNTDSNFKIAIVVDMWITGFDVPSLAVMYIDKPLKKHTLIQTISRVNRVFDGKDRGLVVDYIGIYNDMMTAVKQYGDTSQSPVDELAITLGIFRNHLSMINDLFNSFNSEKFYNGSPVERLNCLNLAAEYVQTKKELESRFMGLSRRLKQAYNICYPSGELTDEEMGKAQFYLAVRSIIYKQTKGDAPDAETMNRVVEKMIVEAIACTGVEDIINEDKIIDLFSDSFVDELSKINLPITKFNALLKLLRKAITDYGKTNKVKAIEFSERLQKVVDTYNSRDKFTFASGVVADFVNDLSDKLIDILKDLDKDKGSFEKMGITYEEKAFYDILVKVRDDHGFAYADDKCIVLAKKIKELIDDKAKYADWSTKDDIKNELNRDLTILLYENGYPPEWDEEVFEKVMEQAENFKKYSN